MGLAGRPAIAAGERWGLRYEETAAIAAAAERRERKRLEARVAQIEAKLAQIEARLGA